MIEAGREYFAAFPFRIAAGEIRLEFRNEQWYAFRPAPGMPDGKLDFDRARARAVLEHDFDRVHVRPPRGITIGVGETRLLRQLHAQPQALDPRVCCRCVFVIVGREPPVE